MFKLIKYLIIIFTIIALIYFLKISFQNNAMQITLRNPQKIENIEKKTMELKKKFSIIEKHEAQPQTTTAQKEKAHITQSNSHEDKNALDKFIKEHSN